jgi:hypothetical protein
MDAKICFECHSTIQPNYRGACVTCLRREIERLRAIVDKLREYDHHTIQAALDQADGDVDPLFYENAEQEAEFAGDALQLAVFMSRGMTESEAADAAERREG